MEISNYNSIYELLGGISSAIVGLDAIRDYVLEKITKHFDGLTDQLEKKAKRCEACIISLSPVIKGFKIGSSNITSEQIKEFTWNAEQLKKFYISKIQLLQRETEHKILDKKLTALFLYIFFYTVTILFIGAMIADGVVSHKRGLELVGDFCIVSIVAMAVISFFVKSNSTKMIRITGLVFLIGIIITIGYSLGIGSGIDVHDMCVIYSSFVVYICPIPIVLTRLIRWRKFSLPKIEKEMYDKETIFNSVHNFAEGYIKSVMNIKKQTTVVNKRLK